MLGQGRVYALRRCQDLRRCRLETRGRSGRTHDSMSSGGIFRPPRRSNRAHMREVAGNTNPSVRRDGDAGKAELAQIVARSGAIIDRRPTPR